MPDRVIDAPIPDSTYEFFREDYERCQNGDKPKESSWACLFMDAVEAIKFLEAEKQEARTEGWNACLAKVAANAEVLGSDVAGRLICALSKPTAAKQGDPS